MNKKAAGQKRKTTKASKQPSANAISRWENEGGATRKVPDDPIARGAAIIRNATEKASKKGKPSG